MKTFFKVLLFIILSIVGNLGFATALFFAPLFANSSTSYILMVVVGYALFITLISVRNIYLTN